MNQQRVFECFVALPHNHPAAQRFGELVKTANKNIADGTVMCRFEDARAGVAYPSATVTLDRIARADFVVALYDGQSTDVLFEIGAASATKKPLLLVTTDRTAELPLNLDGLFWAGFDVMSENVEGIQRCLGAFLEGALKFAAAPADQVRTCVFICYSSRDRDRVEPFASYLNGRGHTVWYDQWRLMPGQSLMDRVDQAISAASHFAPFVSEHWRQSKWTQQELRTAVNKSLSEDSLVIIPVLLEADALEHLPRLLRDTMALKAYEGFVDKEYEELAEAIVASPAPTPLPNKSMQTAGRGRFKGSC